MVEAAQFTVTWQGGKPYDKDGTTEYSIGLKDVGEVEYRKVKIKRPSGTPPPSVGDTLTGHLEQHPRFDDAKLFVEANGAVVGVPGELAVGGYDERQASIEAQVAVKIAADLVIGGKGGEQSFTDLSKKVFDAIQACKAPMPEPQSADTPTEPATDQQGGGGSDDDIPF